MGPEFLQGTTLPILELYGDRGKKPASREQLYLPNRQNITLRWIENASHKLPLEEPDMVAAAIMEFITQIENMVENNN